MTIFTQILKKYSSIIILNLFLFAPNISVAAPTDCIQVATDGTVNCFKATSVWQVAVGNSPKTKTFEELRPFSISSLCANYTSPFVCYEQTSLANPPPPLGRTCSGVASEKFTQEYDQGDNIGGQYVVSYYRTDSGSTYSKINNLVYHLRSCPTGTSQVIPNPNKSLKYCKPLKPITYAKECAVGENKLSCKQI